MKVVVIFQQVELLLGRIGFVKHVTPEGHLIFTYGSSDALLILPGYDADEIVRPIHLASIGGHLDAFGMMERDIFERLLYCLDMENVWLSKAGLFKKTAAHSRKWGGSRKAPETDSSLRSECQGAGGQPSTEVAVILSAAKNPSPNNRAGRGYTHTY